MGNPTRRPGEQRISEKKGCTLHTSLFKNKLLQNLDASIIERFSLRPVILELKHEIQFVERPIESLVFIEEGIGSMTTTFNDGSEVEVGLFGYESVIGLSALMGTRVSLNRVYMQLAGHGFSSTVKAARAEFGAAAGSKILRCAMCRRNSSRPRSQWVATQNIMSKSASPDGSCSVVIAPGPTIFRSLMCSLRTCWAARVPRYLSPRLISKRGGSSNIPVQSFASSTARVSNRERANVIAWLEITSTTIRNTMAVLCLRGSSD